MSNIWIFKCDWCEKVVEDTIVPDGWLQFLYVDMYQPTNFVCSIKCGKKFRRNLARQRADFITKAMERASSDYERVLATIDEEIADAIAEAVPIDT